MKKTMQTEVIEVSSNPHILKAPSIAIEQLTDLGGLKLCVEGKGIVLHGEHGVIVTEEKHVIKLVQQEYNPITKNLQNAFD